MCKNIQLIAQDIGDSDGIDIAKEKQLRPKVAIESESKLAKVALQMLFAYAVVGSHEGIATDLASEADDLLGR